MKSNGYSHLKAIRQTQFTQQPPSAIKSLRSIISILFKQFKDQTKVPLSDYINNQRSSIEKRVSKVQRTRTKTSYFQRFRGMIGNNGIVEKIDEETFITPNKGHRMEIQNMEEEHTFQEAKTIETINKSHVFRKTINHNENSLRLVSRSKSSNQRTNVPDNSKKPNQRPSFQPIKTVKTEHQTIFHNPTLGLPPRPIKLPIQQRNSQIRKPNLPQNEPIPSSSRSQINKSSLNNKPSHLIQQDLHQNQRQKPINDMIEHIHSFRRLNFCKQEERRKQVIFYGKSFQKICQNSNFSQGKVIESSSFEISEVLGNGAFSYVKVGVLKRDGMNHNFAIKIYEKYKLIEPGRKNRVMKQIQILSSLNHPNITKLFCAFQNKRQIHILFEQVQESITLQQYFKHMSLKFTDPDMLFYVMKQTLKGLEYLHSLGIAHRDIKPDNILISFKESKPVVKLIDFGFATSSSVSNIHCGTPNFMAPQLFKKQPYSPIKVDIWASAVMFYYFLESKYPFKGYNEKDLMRNVCQNRIKFEKTPIELQKFLLMMFQTNPDSRISTKEVIALLNCF